MVAMVSNGTSPVGAFAPVLTAMSTMRDGQREQKKAAHAFLESFQKSVGCRRAVAATSINEAHQSRRWKRGRSPSASYSQMQMQRLNYLRLQR